MAPARGGARRKRAAAMGILARSTLLGLVLTGLVAGGESASGLPHQRFAAGVKAVPATATEKPAIEPTSTPGEAPGGGEIERLPGRDDPDEFYKKPPRKPRTRSRMYA